MFTIGRSTIAQLINRAKSQNEFNNNAVASDEVWIDFFNSALNQMTDDLKLDDSTTINHDGTTEDYPLPTDYYGLILLSDNNHRITKRRHFDQTYPQGYWVKNRGDVFVLNLKGYTSPMTLTLHYYRYPAVLDVATKDTQKPEIPTMAEDALVYKAISNALKNNNQLGQAQYFDGLYKSEIAKVNTANTRGRG